MASRRPWAIQFQGKIAANSNLVRTGTDVPTIAGEEIFTVTALDDYSASEPALASKGLQIWPIASASIRGLDPASKDSSLPPITIELARKSALVARDPVGDPKIPLVIDSSWSSIE